jgi:uncharacterized coiled-coil protein SlyX
MDTAAADLTLRLMITVGGALIALLGAWFAVKHGLKEAVTRIEKLEKITADQDHTNDLQWQKVDAQRNTITTVEADVRYLRRDVDELRS